MCLGWRARLPRTIHSPSRSCSLSSLPLTLLAALIRVHDVHEPQPAGRVKFLFPYDARGAMVWVWEGSTHCIRRKCLPSVFTLHTYTGCSASRCWVENNLSPAEAEHWLQTWSTHLGNSPLLHSTQIRQVSWTCLRRVPLEKSFTPTGRP